MVYELEEATVKIIAHTEQKNFFKFYATAESRLGIHLQLGSPEEQETCFIYKPAQKVCAFAWEGARKGLKDF